MANVLWTRSSRCADRNCVEIAVVDGTVAMRDSKNVDQPSLTFSRGEWTSFLAGLAAGDYDRR